MTTALILDAVVIVAYFALVIGIGLWMSRGEKSVEGFALGGRQIAWWAVLASILAAEISAGTFFGAPGEGFALRNYTSNSSAALCSRASGGARCSFRRFTGTAW